MPTEASVPTISIGGFLGSGKTTLVNHVLQHADGRRIVVFVNDFGAINIDYDLIETIETDRVSLANGCVCCSLNDDLVKSMIEFCDTDRPDAFVIEASGVADPRSLDQSLMALQRSGHAHMQRRLYLIDADQFGGLGYADTEDLVDHAVASDLVVLNKADLAKPDQLAGIHRLLTRSAPGADICEAIHGNLPIDLIFRQPMPCKPARALGEPERHNADDAFKTVSFTGFPALKQEEFELLSKTLRSTCLRAKGFVYLRENPTVPILIQLVGDRLQTELRGSDDRSDGQTSRLVAIARPEKIDPQLLGRILRSEPVVL